MIFNMMPSNSKLKSIFACIVLLLLVPTIVNELPDTIQIRRGPQHLRSEKMQSWQRTMPRKRKRLLRAKVMDEFIPHGQKLQRKNELLKTCF